MIKTIFVFICLVIFTSCARLNFKNEELNFSNSEEYFDIGSELVLNEKGIFNYKLRASGLTYIAEGAWEKKGKKIKLNSSEKGKGGIVLAKENISNQNNLKIKVTDLEDDPYIAVNILINDPYLDEIGVTDINGCALLQSTEVDSIRMNYLGFNYYYQVKNKNANCFEFKLKLQDPEIIYFDNQEWILKWNKIYPPKGLELKRNR